MATTEIPHADNNNCDRSGWAVCVFSDRFSMLVEIIASKDNISFNISFKRELSVAMTHISRILLKLWRPV